MFSFKGLVRGYRGEPEQPDVKKNRRCYCPELRKQWQKRWHTYPYNADGVADLAPTRTVTSRNQQQFQFTQWMGVAGESSKPLPLIRTSGARWGRQPNGRASLSASWATP